MKKICQFCKSMGKNQGAGWCNKDKKYTARKATCEKFEKK